MKKKSGSFVCVSFHLRLFESHSILCASLLISICIKDVFYLQSDCLEAKASWQPVFILHMS